MKVFISWSGPRSKELANSLRDWLPMVLQYVKPFVSDKDISAGERWAQTIAGELESANFGIICITPENLDSEWILFESGALSKSMLDGKVIPLLLGLELSDLSGPLSQFQAQKVEKIGIMEVVRAINKVAEVKADEKLVERTVPALWPQLEKAVEGIPKMASAGKHKRPQHEILEELVTGVRGINSRIRDFDPGLEGKLGALGKRRRNRFHPRMIEELGFAFREIDDSPTILLVLAGFLRHDVPWLAEIFTEAYREIKSGGLENAEATIFRLRRTIKHLIRHPMMREISMMSKDTIILLDELPIILEMSFDRMLAGNISSNRRLKGNIAANTDGE